MPELPDITVYVERAAALLVGQVLQQVRVDNPFVLRTAVPPIADAEGRTVVGVQRLGKRVVIALDGERWLVVHLMLAGRLQWQAAKPVSTRAVPPTTTGRQARRGGARSGLIRFEFDAGTLTLTEAGTTRRASLHLLQGAEALAAIDPQSLEVLTASRADFAERLARENHTLKRALTAPNLFSGIGNAYSDEILHRAKLSPVALTRSLPAEAVDRLFDATHAVLTEWTDRLREQAAKDGGWPRQVTAFRPEMAVHGRFGQPCPICSSPVQRIVHAQSESNYCARCQTGGKLLADRALSRLLHASWPKSIDELG